MDGAGPGGPEQGLVRAVLAGYREGAFPMAVEPEEQPRTAWYEADPRGVIRLDGGWRPPRRLARTVRSGRFTVTADQAFGRVIRACADPRREGGWISAEIVEIFEALHRAGLAHSIEAWRPLADVAGRAAAEPTAGNLADRAGDRLLVGGVYGLRVGGVFCAESMFSRPDLGGRDASKVCLVRLLEHLEARGFGLVDTQMWSEHLAQFGCEEVSRGEYLEILAAQRDRACDWGQFTA